MAVKIRIVVLEEVTPCSYGAQTFQTKLLYPPSVKKKDCLILKMEAVGSSETSAPIYSNRNEYQEHFLGVKADGA